MKCEAFFIDYLLSTVEYCSGLQRPLAGRESVFSVISAAGAWKKSTIFSFFYWYCLDDIIFSVIVMILVVR